jgi:hypothetical protein
VGNLHEKYQSTRIEREKGLRAGDCSGKQSMGVNEKKTTLIDK